MHPVTNSYRRVGRATIAHLKFLTVSNRFLPWLVLAVSATACTFAQTDTNSITSDTSRLRISGAAARPEDRSFHPRKSAWLAVGLSAVAPGAGQIYDEKYWKPPVIWGLGGYWVSQWVEQNNQYKHYRDLYSASVKPSFPDGDGQSLSLRNYYRDERDKFAWYLGALYFLNLLDAYVGANLYDFDVGPDLGMNGQVAPRVTATVRFRF